MFDILICNGTVIDGTERPGFTADIAVSGDRIADIGRFPAAQANRTIDASDRVVAPGFIDTHTHSDLMLLADPQHPQGLLQGVTTEILGQDGLSYAPLSHEKLHMYRRYLAGLNGNPDITWDWRTVREYRARFDQTVAINTVYQVPHGAIRLETLGFHDVPLTGESLLLAKKLVQQAFAEGVVAFSTGLSYYPCAFGDTAELIELCKTVRAMHGLYVTHQRSVFRPGQERFDPTWETLEIARQSGVSVHFSHYRTGIPNAGQVDRLMAPIEAGLAQGLDLTLELYPYSQGCGPLLVFLPMWAVRGGYWDVMNRLSDPNVRRQIARDLDPVALSWYPTWHDAVFSYVPSAANSWMEGRTFAEVAKLRHTEPEFLILDVLYEEGLEVGVRGAPPRDEGILRQLGEDFVRLLARPYYMVGSDSIAVGGRPHPRAWGCFARFFRLRREHPDLMTLEQLINRMTFTPARRFGLLDRGEIARGKAADLVILDPDKVCDRATYERPKQPPVGIEHVLVNGRVAVEDGICTGVYAGRALPR